MARLDTQRLRGARLLAVVLACMALAACGSDQVETDAGQRAAELASAGEAAFFDTLYGIADRGGETVDLLSRAVTLNPHDGPSQFRLGMMHMYRFSQSIADYRNATAAEQAEIRAAHRALDAAVPLLADDRRIPGFRAAATYMVGFVTHDPSLVTLGLEQLRAAIALFPEFNNFDFIGVVAPTVTADDPLYAEVLAYVGDPLTAACSPFNQPELCGNLGKAPHNVEGALVLFGDLYAKAGDTAKARSYYRLAQAPFPTTGGPWRFQGLIQERIDTVNERVALYLDGDPSNDPPLLGYREEACAVCHYK